MPGDSEFTLTYTICNYLLTNQKQLISDVSFFNLVPYFKLIFLLQDQHMINPRTWIKELIIEEVFKGIDKKAAELVPKVKYKVFNTVTNHKYTYSHVWSFIEKSQDIIYL